MVPSKSDSWMKMQLPKEITALLSAAPYVGVPETRTELLELAAGRDGVDEFEVAYKVPNHGRVVEATVTRCRNGISVNYPDPYMRRRDPESLVIADELPSDKTRFADRYDAPFSPLRSEIIDWLSQQDLVVVPFKAGGLEHGYPACMIAPVNAAFFAVAMADLQGMIPASEIDENFQPRAIVYVAPTFRHTHCEGQQIVVHNRTPEMHEVFSLNLYLGPSAKKGVYGVLLTIGEEEGWTTLHGSTVQVVTPYDNIITVMHEGASGGGKSEMLQYPHREKDGRLLLGENTVTGDQRHVTLPRGCELRPVTDDMAICHPAIQNNGDKLVVADAENSWFVRINHIDHYGTDPELERLCIHAPEPFLYLNLNAAPHSTCLIWEHAEDAPGQPCPNPRVVLLRNVVPGVVDEPVAVDVRSFGFRTPPCTKKEPSYGIVGLLHILPPSLAWLWRLVSPRGFSNPSITDTEGMTSEGVGSYWPFATGRRVDQANLLLKQIVDKPGTRFTLSPNQHVGCWKVGFMPQWIVREYLARRGSARFRPEMLTPARCSLLGYTIPRLVVEGTQIPKWFLQVDSQPEIGEEGYDAGAEILTAFFNRELQPYLKEADLDPLGRQIIECCLAGGSIEEYEKLICSQVS